MPHSNDVESTTGTEHHVADSEEESAGVAGVARALVRGLTRNAQAAAKLVARADIGSLPRGKVPVHTMTRVTEKISDAMEVWYSFKEGKESADKYHGTSQGGRWNTIKRAAASVLHSLPPFIRSSVLGTVLFSAYEDVERKISMQLSERVPVEDMLKAQPQEVKYVLLQSLPAGLLAGGAHGFLYSAWGAAAERNIKLLLKPPLVSHALAHGSLFASYEVNKVLLMSKLSTHPTELAGAAVVAGAGGLAGSVQEAVTHYTTLYERKGLRAVRAAIRNNNLPNWRSVAIAAPGAAVGFLAWEYGRQIAEFTMGHGENEDD